MSTVRDLAPGDVVDGPGGNSATFISATEHPIYGGLRLVTWAMPDGSTSLDALSPFQYVGDARRTDANGREAALRQALNPVVAEEPEWEYGVVGPTGRMVNNGDYTIQQTHRRRKAGPWVPVNQEGEKP